MANDAEIWRVIAEREGLTEPNLLRLASLGDTDNVFTPIGSGCGARLFLDDG